MKKRIAALALVAGMALSSLTFLSACAREPGGTTGSAWEEFADEKLAENEARISVRRGKGYLRWAQNEDIKEYDVYSSASLYGKYDKINKKAIKGEKYEIDFAPYEYFKVVGTKKDGGKAEYEPVSVFGETMVVASEDDMQKVQAYIDDAHATLEKGEFSDKRVAVYFRSGTYSDVTMQLGYYTSVAGLGETPDLTTVNNLYVSTNILPNNNATCTFWRSVENISFNGTTRWAVSQATSMRRTQINGDLELAHPNGWSSGGFLANSKVKGTVLPYTQQQWMSRNDDWENWSGAGHNYVFSGCTGTTPASVWSESAGRFTNIEKTEKVAEKPFLYCNDKTGEYNVFVPECRENTVGISWENGLREEKGKTLSLDEFYIADPKTDTSETLNAALSAGQNLLFTPGKYLLETPLKIERENTVVMGMGYATLTIADTNKECAIRVAEVDGVRLCDLLIDAGNKSEAMVVVGEEGKNVSHDRNPIVLSNIYLRIGGFENKHTETENAMVINANDTIGDHFWIWRADHSLGVAWNDYEDNKGNIVYGNPAKTGLLVNADNVRCYALMVEHFEGYQTLWKGENGLTVMYQCETPYSMFSQEDWKTPEGRNGYAGYKVDDKVNAHRAYGVGIYLVNYNDVRLSSAIEAPENDGIHMEHLVTCRFASNAGAVIENVINDIGGAVGPEEFRKLVVLFGK